MSGLLRSELMEKLAEMGHNVTVRQVENAITMKYVARPAKTSAGQFCYSPENVAEIAGHFSKRATQGLKVAACR